ncbi:hypothetical protein NQ314_007119 [Rhamnusium bicolor]|uniref:Regulatory protein zeste n=1 Tax=Rhamnusium bicolor TaxID=1586634 RepID=A0AAV8YS72_9CUCU|nr:hypothetical protein NQ314_007119 [Rhamnusium bicolor]
MASKMQDAHWLILIDFMEKHPSLATGKFTSASGKDQYKKLWLELAGLLNGAGYGQRTLQKWQKVITKLWC